LKKWNRNITSERLEWTCYHVWRDQTRILRIKKLWPNRSYSVLTSFNIYYIFSYNCMLPKNSVSYVKESNYNKKKIGTLGILTFYEWLHFNLFKSSFLFYALKHLCEDGALWFPENTLNHKTKSLLGNCIWIIIHIRHHIIKRDAKWKCKVLYVIKANKTRTKNK
jgi:hypothetical protein